MSPAWVIHAATKTNAEMLGWEDRIGSINTGKYADLIAVADDPLADVTELQRVKFVMKAGKIIVNEVSSASEPRAIRPRSESKASRVGKLPCYLVGDSSGAAQK